MTNASNHLPSRSGPQFGAIVRHHRKRAGLSQARLAKVAGVGKTVVFDIEKGKPTVRLDILLRILDALNVRLDWHSPSRASFEAEREEGAAQQEVPRA